jgi:hypothetical protein
MSPSPTHALSSESDPVPGESRQNCWGIFSNCRDPLFLGFAVLFIQSGRDGWEGDSRASNCRCHSICCCPFLLFIQQTFLACLLCVWFLQIDKQLARCGYQVQEMTQTNWSDTYVSLLGSERRWGTTRFLSGKGQPTLVESTVSLLFLTARARVSPGPSYSGIYLLLAVRISRISPSILLQEGPF